MSRNMQNSDIRTDGYVIRRTNYGEADRILNLITPKGKISAIARGVRKEKSKLAGGIEMFTLTDYIIHNGRGELGVITSAKMKKHYGEIVKDWSRMELAANVLKKISKVADGVDSSEYFEIAHQAMGAINSEVDLGMVEAWCVLNLKRAAGEEINLYRDVSGERLSPEEKYQWDSREMAFVKYEGGEYGANEIKLLRLILTNKYDVIKRVKIDGDMMARVVRLAHMVV